MIYYELLWIFFSKQRKNEKISPALMLMCTTVYFLRFIHLLSDIFLLLFIKIFHNLTYRYVLSINLLYHLDDICEMFTTYATKPKIDKPTSHLLGLSN